MVSLIRKVTIYFIFLSLFSFSFTPTIHASLTPDDRFAVGTTFMLDAFWNMRECIRYGFNCLTEAEERERLRKLAKAFHESGAKNGREDFSWNILQPDPSYIDWTLTDMAMEYYEEGRDKVQGILIRTPIWASSAPPGTPDSEKIKYPAGDEATWVNYVRNVVTRYKNKVKYWEVWSEADIPGNNFIPTLGKTREESYFYLLRSAYNTIKEIDPSLQVLINGFGSWNITGSFDNPGIGDGMVRFVMTYGEQPYFDIFNIHTYVGHDPAIEVQNARTLLSHWPSTANKDIWITETNSHVYLRQHFGGQSGVTIARSAEYMRWWFNRHFESGSNNKVFWFTIANWPCEPEDPCFEIPGLITNTDFKRQVTWYEFRNLVYGMPSLRAGWQTNFTISKIPEFCPYYSNKNSQGFWDSGILNYNRSLSTVPSNLYFLCR